jgi:hypothetical protein
MNNSVLQTLRTEEEDEKVVDEDVVPESSYRRYKVFPVKTYDVTKKTRSRT